MSSLFSRRAAAWKPYINVLWQSKLPSNSEAVLVGTVDRLNPVATGRARAQENCQATQHSLRKSTCLSDAEPYARTPAGGICCRRSSCWSEIHTDNEDRRLFQRMNSPSTTTNRCDENLSDTGHLAFHHAPRHSCPTFQECGSLHRGLNHLLDHLLGC